jgi:hypothetical protein
MGEPLYVKEFVGGTDGTIVRPASTIEVKRVAKKLFTPAEIVEGLGSVSHGSLHLKVEWQSADGRIEIKYYGDLDEAIKRYEHLLDLKRAPKIWVEFTPEDLKGDEE